MSDITREELKKSLLQSEGLGLSLDDGNIDLLLEKSKVEVHRNESNELISFMLYRELEKEVEIIYIWTSPECRLKGFASRLFQGVVRSTLKELVMYLPKGHHAVPFFQLNKFTPSNVNTEKSEWRYPKRTAIMQPYIFPYIGYFHLIEAADVFVFYDDVNFIKRGWINRNRILLNQQDFLFTIPVEKASQNNLIKDTPLAIDQTFTKKWFAQLENAYKKAPYFKTVFELIQCIHGGEHASISDYAIESIKSIYHYLGKDLNCAKSSLLSPHTQGMDKADRLIQITLDLGYQNYVNAIGGTELYDKPYFAEKGVELSFVKSREVIYKQFDHSFVPWLSIIDVMMFNDPRAILEMMREFDLV